MKSYLYYINIDSYLIGTSAQRKNSKVDAAGSDINTRFLSEHSIFTDQVVLMLNANTHLTEKVKTKKTHLQSRHINKTKCHYITTLISLSLRLPVSAN